MGAFLKSAKGSVVVTFDNNEIVQDEGWVDVGITLLQDTLSLVGSRQ